MHRVKNKYRIDIWADAALPGARSTSIAALPAVDDRAPARLLQGGRRCRERRAVRSRRSAGAPDRAWRGDGAPSRARWCAASGHS